METYFHPKTNNNNMALTMPFQTILLIALSVRHPEAWNCSHFFLQIFVPLNLCACDGGSTNGVAILGEECDTGLHCASDCTCESGYESTTPLSIDCQEVCLNPVDPLSSNQVQSGISVSLVSSLVDFHAVIGHQTTAVGGSKVCKLFIIQSLTG